MPIKSKYSTQQVELIINELLAVLSNHDANVELSLMCLGNATSHIISQNVAKQQQPAVVKSFNQALNAAIAP